MDRSSASRLIKDTFESPFDKPKFQRFVRELLNRYEDKPFGPYTGSYIKDAFAGSIKSYERIGRYTDSDDNEIDILIVHLCRETSLAHARTMQRNFVAWYLDRGRGGIQRDAALVAMVSPGEEDWRFSLVRMDYRLETSAAGRIKPTTEFTPARRYSFLVGANERSHTAQQSLVPLLINEDSTPTLNDLEQAFNIETVTKEFFEKYKELFLRVKESLDAIVESDAKVRAGFVSTGVDTADFAKKLLGQIVFLYFLQKKGWFGVGRDASWGDGPKGFIRSLFEKNIAPYKNFFNDILEPMFYEALAVERHGDFYSRFNCKIPFLNGGLFDPINGYDWIHTDILLPNHLFSNQNKTPEGDTGDGILDVFDRYNFTVCEDEPLEKEVAVDPEMLGKVFENLLEIKDRKSKGAFYTPREIVHYMCQESLINYLATEAPSIEKQDLELLIRHGDAAIENDARVEAAGRETERYSYRLPEAIRNNAAVLDGKLSSVRVCDPAVGSGAFLVGMMNEVVRARRVLGTFLDKPSTPYDLKRHAIHNCLYGVDIDPGAVDIAKLRLWLSLVVDEEDIRQIKPLPNLDYKIMQGNSLLEEYEGIKLFDDTLLSDSAEYTEMQIREFESRRSKIQQEYFDVKLSRTPDKLKLSQLEQEIKRINDAIKKLQIPQSGSAQINLEHDSAQARKKAEKLKALHSKFFDEAHKREKDEIRKQIDELEWDLIETTLREQRKTAAADEIQRLRTENVKPFFLWKLHFADVFEEKGGFDIAIANPPYVRMEMRKSIRDALSSQYPDVHAERADLYCYFYALAVRILRQAGTLSFISSNKWFRAGYGSKLRKHMADNCDVLGIIDFGELPVFENAATFPMIFIAQKADHHRAQPTMFVQVKSLEAPYPDILALVQSSGFVLPSNAIEGSEWQLIDMDTALFVGKMETDSTPLSEYVRGRIYRGIVTGLNEAFYVTSEVRSMLVRDDPRSENVLKPILVGDEIRRWHIESRHRSVIYMTHGVNPSDYPAVIKHLSAFRKRLEHRANKQEWYELQQPQQRFEFAYTQPKIIYPDICKEPRFTLDPTGHYLDATATCILTDDLFLLGLLNSSPVWRYLCSKCAVLGDAEKGGRVRLKTFYVEQIPVPAASSEDREAISSLVRKCLDAEGVDCRRWELEIDRRVSLLYGFENSPVT